MIAVATVRMVGVPQHNKLHHRNLIFQKILSICFRSLHHSHQHIRHTHGHKASPQNANLVLCPRCRASQAPLPPICRKVTHTSQDMADIQAKATRKECCMSSGSALQSLGWARRNGPERRMIRNHWYPRNNAATIDIFIQPKICFRSSETRTWRTKVTKRKSSEIKRRAAIMLPEMSSSSPLCSGVVWSQTRAIVVNSPFLSTLSCTKLYFQIDEKVSSK